VTKDTTQFAWPRDCFFKVAQSFCRRKAITKSQILWLQIWFTHIFLKWTEVTFKQEVSGVYTVFRYRLTRKWKVSGAPRVQTWTAQSRVTNQQEGMVISEQLLVWDMNLFFNSATPHDLPRYMLWRLLLITIVFMFVLDKYYDITCLCKVLS